ncbi:hypothetical protein Tco_0486651 [Tanacetum coccineum]
MELCTTLSQRVLDLENTNTSQAVEITKLKKSVKKLDRRNKSRTPGLKRLRKVGRTARIESSKEEGLGDQEDASKQGRKIADINADEETLIEINAAKPKAVRTAATTTTTAVTRPKARGVVIKEPKIAQRLQEEFQAELEEEERLARQKEEDANIAE